MGREKMRRPGAQNAMTNIGQLVSFTVAATVVQLPQIHRQEYLYLTPKNTHLN